MSDSKKVVFNMVTIYVKILITMLISLFTVPIVLKSLGAADFGLYNLIAGIVLMLSFLNGSMSVSTQRYISVWMGAKDELKILKIFNVSVILHFLVGLIVVLLLEASSLFLFNGFLNIDQSRIFIAKIVFQCLIGSTFFTIISVPFDSLINSNENFFALSIIEIINSILILIVVLCMEKINGNLLIYYSVFLTITTSILMFMKFFYCKYKYVVCKFNFKYFEKDLFLEMFSFAGWNTFGAIAMMGRNQGIAVVLNLFYGTVVNAAYGIANQVNSVLSNFSITLQKSINPQLMKSEGENNRERMIKMSFISSKFSVLTLSVFLIPLIIEMPFVLNIWLNEIPENTIWFCRLILILTLIGQYSTGLMSAIQSVGNIKYYTITISILLLLNIPIDLYLLSINLPPYSVLICAILIEIILLFVRLFFAKKLTELPASIFIKDIIIRTLIPIIINLILCYLLSTIIDIGFLNLIIITLISTIILSLLVKFISLSDEENIFFKNFILISMFKLKVSLKLKYKSIICSKQK